MADELRLVEYLTPADQIVHTIDDMLLSARTRFQSVKIVNSRSQGKALLLDGVWQSCTRDEFIYHESLVHPAILEHGRAKSVLVLGGGEGATAREALRWRGVERVVMVDIDSELIEHCREHLPEMNSGAYDDPRLELVIGDALEFLDTTQERWDVVISDLSDPIEHGPSYRFFTREYFERARRVVADGGKFVVQAGTVAPIEVAQHARLHRTVAEAFGHACTYVANVPSFGTPWGFVLGADTPIEAAPNPARVDGQLAEGLDPAVLGFIGGATVLGARLLPPYLRRALEDPAAKAYTLADPPRFGSGIGSSI